MIAETRCFELGPFRIQQRPRQDSPGWAVYVVFRGAALIGKQFSLPSLSDCLWLERWGVRYADPKIAAPRAYGYTAQKLKRQLGTTAKEPEPLS